MFIENFIENEKKFIENNERNRVDIVISQHLTTK